jgi:hypothetical protein
MTTGRRPPGYMTEDLEPKVSGPARYTSKTDKAVDHITIADESGAVIGFFSANDDDDAAGWIPHATASPAQQNLAAPWMALLRDAKQRGLKPTAALDELLSAAPSNKSKATGSRQRTDSLTALKQVASQ